MTVPVPAVVAVTVSETVQVAPGARVDVQVPPTTALPLNPSIAYVGTPSVTGAVPLLMNGFCTVNACPTHDGSAGSFATPVCTDWYAGPATPTRASAANAAPP